MDKLLIRLLRLVAPGKWAANGGHGPAARREHGFTVIEVIIAMALVALVYAMALPSIGRTRVHMSVHNSKHMVVSSISLARATAMRFGRTAVVRLDADGDRIWVEADTTLEQTGVLDTLGLFDLGGELKVDLKSNRETLCFNGRGIGTRASACPQTGATIIVALKDRADTVRVSSVGRVLQ